MNKEKVRNTKNVTISVPKSLMEDKDAIKNVYAIYGRSGLSGMFVDALKRIKEKGKL